MFLRFLSEKPLPNLPVISFANFKDHQYDLLAEHFRTHLDMEKLFEIVGFDKETCKLIRAF